jgi:hypothetical protein
MNIPIAFTSILIVTMMVCVGVLTLAIVTGFKNLGEGLAPLAQPLTRLAESYARVAAVEEGKQAWYKERQRLRRSQHQNNRNYPRKERYERENFRDSR